MCINQPSSRSCKHFLPGATFRPEERFRSVRQRVRDILPGFEGIKEKKPWSPSRRSVLTCTSHTILRPPFYPKPRAKEPQFPYLNCSPSLGGGTEKPVSDYNRGQTRLNLGDMGYVPHCSRLRPVTPHWALIKPIGQANYDSHFAGGKTEPYRVNGLKF